LVAWLLPIAESEESESMPAYGFRPFSPFLAQVSNNRQNGWKGSRPRPDEGLSQ